YMGLSDNAMVNVSGAKLTGISVSPVVVSLKVGQNQLLQATALYDDGTNQPVGFVADWISSAPAIADVSNGGGFGGPGGPGGGGRGTVTALKAGTTTITATYMSMMASTTVTVTGATVQSIQVSPVNPMITKGGTVQLQAVAIYSDNTSRNVTGMATW